MRPAAIIEAICWYALYAAFAVFALTANSASPLYRAVFVDKNQADYLTQATRDYAPGQLIRGSEPSAYFAYRWWGPSEDGRWGRGERNEIVLVPTSDLSAGSSVTASFGVEVGGTKQSQLVILMANGVEVWRGDLGGHTNINVPLRVDARAGEQLTIAFLLPGLQSPLQRLVRGDLRELGIHLQTLALVPPN